MTLPELALAIEAYPKKLSDALSAVQKIEEKIEKLQDQIEEEEIALSPVEETSTDDTPLFVLDEQLLKIDHDIMMLDLRYEQLRGVVELEFRRNPPPGDKVTEATVSAVVRSDERLFNAKKQYIDKKHEKDQLLFNRNTERKSTRIANRMADTEPTSPKLERLKEKLASAELDLSIAEHQVEEVKASISSYQLLVQLYTSGILK